MVRPISILELSGMRNLTHLDKILVSLGEEKLGFINEEENYSKIESSSDKWKIKKSQLLILKIL